MGGYKTLSVGPARAELTTFRVAANAQSTQPPVRGSVDKTCGQNVW